MISIWSPVDDFSRMLCVLTKYETILNNNGKTLYLLHWCNIADFTCAASLLLLSQQFILKKAYAHVFRIPRIVPFFRQFHGWVWKKTRRTRKLMSGPVWKCMRVMFSLLTLFNWTLHWTWNWTEKNHQLKKLSQPWTGELILWLPWNTHQT